MMRLWLLFFMLVTAPAALADIRVGERWYVEKSRHFVVYYRNARTDFVAKTVNESEEYYDTLSGQLGFKRRNYWTGENRAKIYIYDNAQEYQSATRQPGWSSAYVATHMKEIHTFPNARGFFESILPHELGHVVFGEFVGFDNPAVPVWLEEGVASYLEKERYLAARQEMRDAARKDIYISLEELAKLHPLKLPDARLVNLFYTESVSVVDYLIKEFGEEGFVSFCEHLRDKRDFERALRSVYGFHSMKELNDAWFEYIKR